MNKLRIWSNTVKKDIEIQKENIYKKDYKFFKIDRLEKISEHIDDFSSECHECKAYKDEITDIVEKLADYVNGSIRKRAEYEKRSEKIISHLKKGHSLVASTYYTSLYSLLGLIIGFGSFGAIAYLINPDYFRFSVLIGFVTGLVVGKIIGNNKDKLVKKENRVLD